ncbi:unnamed protein product [Symbiodinium sp. CCMP2592]|nr:unnamed protein product [Symbiodinium sp. CCMP2592]CAE7242500.1 unnamed protein product [Symbiodinium sp. CCMP2592]CAE7248734.1 unnamed protein product [Symbiodinium sp. CCMP2592]CAE7549617.1 unnamed protein product [Symbiodinium sp. CCMP2592]
MSLQVRNLLGVSHVVTEASLGQRPLPVGRQPAEHTAAWAYESDGSWKGGKSKGVPEHYSYELMDWSWKGGGKSAGGKPSEHYLDWSWKGGGKSAAGKPSEHHELDLSWKGGKSAAGKWDPRSWEGKGCWGGAGSVWWGGAGPTVTEVFDEEPQYNYGPGPTVTEVFDEPLPHYRAGPTVTEVFDEPHYGAGPRVTEITEETTRPSARRAAQMAPLPPPPLCRAIRVRMWSRLLHLLALDQCQSPQRLRVGELRQEL